MLFVKTTLSSTHQTTRPKNKEKSGSKKTDKSTGCQSNKCEKSDFRGGELKDF